LLVKEGTNACNAFNPHRPLPNGPTANNWAIRYFEAWQKNCNEVLLKYNLDSWDALFFKDTRFGKRGSSVDDYIKACKAGLERLEELLKDLGD